MRRRDRKPARTPDSKKTQQTPGHSAPGAKPPRNIPWHLVLLVLVLVAPFASVLFFPGGRVLGNPECDNPSAYYYMDYFAAQSWRQGIIPLWNPYIMLGLPFIGEGQASVFHPISFLLYILLPTGQAINWLIALSFILTGLFFYGYLRALGLGRPAAWCGAVTWSFSNAMISRIYAGHLNILLLLISIPLILMLWEKHRADGRVRWLVGIAFAYAAMILAFFPQLQFIFSLFFLLYVLIQSWLAIRGGAPALHEGRAIVRLGLFILLGTGLGAIQLFPSFDYASRSFRQTVSFDFGSSYSFPPENLLTMLAPRILGTSVTSPDRLYWGRYNFWEMWLYLGILPLIMAVVGAWTAPPRRRAALLTGAILFLLIGLGNNTPVFWLVYHAIPGFDLFRCPCRNVLITLCCLVALSAYGFESLFCEQDDARRRRARRIALIAGTGLLVFAAALRCGLFYHADTPGSIWRHFASWVQYGDVAAEKMISAEAFRLTAANAARALNRSILLIVGSLALVGLLRLPRPWRHLLRPAATLFILADLLSVFLPLIKTFNESITRYPQESREALRDTIDDFPYPPRILTFSPTPNIAMRYGYSSAFGYVGNTLQRYNDFINALQGAPRDVPRAFSQAPKFNPYFQLLAFDALIVDRRLVPPNVRVLKKIGRNRVMVAYDEIQKRIPRAFLAATPRYFTQREDALSYVFSRQGDVQASPAIERPRGGVAPAPLDDSESVRFISFGMQRVELEVRANHPRELVLCGMFEHNWTARVNGRHAVIGPANYVFRAVQVPAGISRVVFRYRPRAFYWGVAVSAASLAALLLIGLLAWLKPSLTPAAAGWGLLPVTRGWRLRRQPRRALARLPASAPAAAR